MKGGRGWMQEACGGVEEVGSSSPHAQVLLAHSPVSSSRRGVTSVTVHGYVY